VSRLAWIAWDAPTGSSDEQAAAPDERGSYGELMDEIDRLLKNEHASGPPAAFLTSSRRRSVDRAMRTAEDTARRTC
jgi:hypothetical protein